jgi:AcrR family transcriptional regulator
MTLPRAPRTHLENQQFKDRIIDTALRLVVDGGFKNLSMRRIASKLKISATTIYNYVSGKDELNLMIRMRGFGMLYKRLERGYRANGGFEERIGGMIRGYVDFGINYPAYYDIMFSLGTPKYLDYVGTRMEPVARKEKDTALRCFDIFSRMFSEYLLAHGGDGDDDFIGFVTAKAWSDLHGIVSLYNSRVLLEITENGRFLLNRRVNDIILTVLDSGKSPGKAAEKSKKRR